MPLIETAMEVLQPGESAMVIFTDGRHFADNGNGTGSSGWWRIAKRRKFERVVIYRRVERKKTGGEIFIGKLQRREEREGGRSLLHLTDFHLIGETEANWRRFAFTHLGGVRYLSKLTIPAQAILQELVTFMRTHKVVPNQPETFAGYKYIHDALTLPLRAETYGDSLKVQGLEELARWTLRDGYPAITGLIVDQASHLPGKGYFEVFEKAPDDYVWWASEIENSLNYDWRPFLRSITELQTPQPTPEASDFDAPPPERIQTSVYRILRDTVLARRVKMMHNFECQICGHTITLPDGSRYAEAHHIQPLGQPHSGPDIIGNILCVCPNHHAELDYGTMALDELTFRHLDNHPVGTMFVEYHNRHIHGGRQNAV